MKSTAKDTIEAALSELIDALAAALIDLRITPSRLAQLARVSFVKASATRARKKSSGRPHLAKIAAITGLSRVEVKRIVLSGFRVGEPEAESWPRACRVLLAWKKALRLKSGGLPSKLRITGSRNSFRALCRAHSGDIPPRVILSELERTGGVKVNLPRTHVSLRPVAEREQPTKSVASLRFATALAAAALREDCVLVRRKQRVPSSAVMPAPYVEDAISSRVNEMLDQMPKLFPVAKGRRRKSLSVFALVVREKKSRGAL